jgi:hypothetical protein
LLLRVVWQKLTDVPEECIAFIFMAEEKSMQQTSKTGGKHLLLFLVGF